MNLDADELWNHSKPDTRIECSRGCLLLAAWLPAGPGVMLHRIGFTVSADFGTSRLTSERQVPSDRANGNRYVRVQEKVRWLNDVGDLVELMHSPANEANVIDEYRTVKQPLHMTCDHMAQQGIVLRAGELWTMITTLGTHVVTVPDRIAVD